MRSTLTMAGLILLLPAAAFAADGKFASHPPMRPLAAPSSRPLADGPARFVDARKGADANDGSAAKPWQTLRHALTRLQPGDTLYLRGGTYYEHVVVPVSGTADKPITIRSHPGELAILDGGLREFFEEPASAWELHVDTVEKAWLDTKVYEKYGLVVIVGNLVRAKIEPNKYTKEDLERVKNFLEGGGTLLLMRIGTDVFATPEGRDFLAELTGASPKEASPKLEIRQPDHPWLKHLDPRLPHPWLTSRQAVPLRTSKGESLIGTAKGGSILYRLRAGKGQIIYLGWEIAESLPAGKKASTLDQERVFEEQIHLLMNIAAELYPGSRE